MALKTGGWFAVVLSVCVATLHRAETSVPKLDALQLRKDERAQFDGPVASQP